MTMLEDIHRALERVPDPEMPISIVELGIVHAVRFDSTSPTPRVEVDITPTFIGCPALEMIREQIVLKIRAVAPNAAVEVRFVNDPPWSVDLISETGREKLREFGVSVPQRGAATIARSATMTPLTVSGESPASPGAAPACPFCGSAETHLESRFGPTRCKMIYYCDACRNSFEHLKPI